MSCVYSQELFDGAETRFRVGVLSLPPQADVTDGRSDFILMRRRGFAAFNRPLACRRCRGVV